MQYIHVKRIIKLSKAFVKQHSFWTKATGRDWYHKSSYILLRPLDILLSGISRVWDMDRHPFSIENILKDTRGAGGILKIAPTSEALALAERMAGRPLFYYITEILSNGYIDLNSKPAFSVSSLLVYRRKLSIAYFGERKEKSSQHHWKVLLKSFRLNVHTTDSKARCTDCASPSWTSAGSERCKNSSV